MQARECYYGSCTINILHTVYWQYHSSVAVLPLMPAALVAIRQQTRDICQYKLCNLYVLNHSTITNTTVFTETMLSIPGTESLGMRLILYCQGMCTITVREV